MTDVVVQEATRLVVQYGVFDLKPVPDGLVVEQIDETLTADLEAALKVPNGGIVLPPDHSSIETLPPQWPQTIALGLT